MQTPQYRYLGCLSERVTLIKQRIALKFGIENLQWKSKQEFSFCLYGFEKKKPQLNNTQRSSILLKNRCYKNLMKISFKFGVENPQRKSKKEFSFCLYGFEKKSAIK